LITNNIAFGRSTGALRIRTSKNEVNVDFLAEKKPTELQIAEIERLKSIDNRKLFFEIMDKNNKPIKGYGGFNKTIIEMKKQIREFYITK